MTAPVRDRTARRGELLDAADRIVRRDGPAASMAAIAAEAGITKPVLYRHFGDRGGLFGALTDRWTELLLVSLRASLSAPGSRRERFERTVGAYLSVIETEPQVYRFLVHSEEAAGLTPQVRGFTRSLADLLATGLALDLDLPAPTAREQVWAAGIVGMVQAAGDWWLDAPGAGREQVARDLTDLVWGAYPGLV